MTMESMQEIVDRLQPLKQRLEELLGEADTEMQSICCGAAKHEYVDDMCSGCNEIVTFEEVAI